MVGSVHPELVNAVKPRTRPRTTLYFKRDMNTPFANEQMFRPREAILREPNAEWCGIQRIWADFPPVDECTTTCSRKVVGSIPLCHNMEEIRHSDRCAGSARRTPQRINGFRHLAHPKSRVCGNRHGFTSPFPQASQQEVSQVPTAAETLDSQASSSIQMAARRGALTGTLRQRRASRWVYERTTPSRACQ